MWTHASPAGTLMMRGTLAWIGAGGQAVEQLVDDLGRLPDLLQPDPVAGEGVAVGVGPDLPVELASTPAGEALVAAEVAVDARGPGVGARQAVLQGDVRAG